MDDGLLLLMILIALAIPLGVVILFVLMAGTRGRVTRLEQQLAELRAELARRPETAPASEENAQPAAIPEPPPQAEVWPRAVPQDLPEETVAPDQNRPLVIRPDRFAALGRWLRENWVYAVSALSLAFAGVFFVQYGMEKGLLPPVARVVLAILFGAGLIGAGEWIRRRHGDGVDRTTAYLPSVFSGAGIVAIFAGVAAGRLLYDLYGAGTAFAGLVVTAGLAVALGWRHGPLLVAIGLLGAAATPFLVSGGGGTPAWLFAHYVLVAALGLAVDAFRRWAWISVLALVLAHAGMALIALGGGSEGAWMWALFALALVAIILPEKGLLPTHAGPSVTRALWRRDGVWPAFPVRLAAGNLLAVVLTLLLLVPHGSNGILAALLLTGLALLLILWAAAAPGLEDLAALPAAGLLALLALAEPLIWAFRDQAIVLRAPESAAPATVTLLLGLAALISAAAGWRSLQTGARPQALGAVLVAPLAASILEMLWHPTEVLGAYPWALHVMALAAGMVGLAVLWARADGAPGARTAWATLSALSLIALALFLLTSSAALTLALGVLVAAAAALDRRFNLPEMGWFIQAGGAVLSWRLVADPGLDWALQASWGGVLAAYLGAALACAAGLRLMPAGRVLPRAVLESLGLAALALLANVVILRLLQPDPMATDWQPDWALSHWGAALNALPWLILTGTQLWRAGATAPGWTHRFRLAIAAGAGIMAASGLLLALVPFNPLFNDWAEDPVGLVRGPVLLDSLFLAYALPGLLLLIAPPRLRVLPARGRLVLRAIGVALLTVYAGEEIRRLWQGRWIGGPGVLQGELYSYTLAMLVTGAAMLWQALARQSALLQRMAMGVIGLTAAKVFLWDAAGLTGLTRVVSFAGLGLSLAGLAWLNRWAQSRLGETPSELRD
ncbi:hypothetical protein GCM10011452_19530 [Gemmobacter lanyuensis]|uniref:DUF2339 domain-containing protein n=1 Tax=Gemmobacter lanyuensis TaxID=1054497 RepID=A0A918ISW7_9RHOB|nr:DUF2339 domain-containing protein [Gemmobacter lanyuensis]GGW31124.1 hypothetical protein GCM10011452_19530 [Gemmobacter lanyuensis]